MLGKHTIKHWASTQPSVSLSSGEAEFYGLVRGSGQGLGYQALLKDLGLDLPLRMWTDSSAAIGICSRQGLGKLRHIDTHTLRVQQAVRSKRLEIKKVLGEENPADLLTKHSLPNDRLDKLVELFDCHFMDGRAESAPMTRTGHSDKKTMAQADAMVGNIEEGSPVMPHTQMSATQLEKDYPSLTVVDDLDLPEPEGPEIPDTFEEFTRASSPRRAVPPRLLLGLLAVALMLIVARAAQLLFAA